MKTTKPAGRSEARAEAILSAVVELIEERGYERVTVDAIAARARASKATMYRRWPTKADLVVDAVRLHAGTDAPADSLPDTGSLRGDLLAALDGISRVISGPSGVSLLKLVEAVRDDPVLRELIRAQVTQGGRSAAGTITARAVARGELPAGTPPTAGGVLELAFAQLLLTALIDGAPASDEQRARLADTVLLPLIRQPAAPSKEIQ